MKKRAAPRTVTDVYIAADADNTPAQQRYVERMGAEAAARANAREAVKRKPKRSR